MAEPDPILSPDSVEVYPKLREFLDGIADQSLLDLVDERYAMGREKYNGMTLHTHNGRDAVQDAIEELLDFLYYIMQAKMEGKLRSWLASGMLVQTRTMIEDLLDAKATR